MPADHSRNQQPSLQAVLAMRYPNWTIWFGEATRRWWALASHDRSAGKLVEARSVEELIESIEAMRGRQGRIPGVGPVG